MDFLLIGVGLIIASACLLMYAGYYARKMEAKLGGDSGSAILDINGNFVALQFAESRKKEAED